MVERMDIDALLIGSLYGELSAAEEARLQAHLESHPADRTALANITQARSAFRESQFAARLYDPPQSVSARLLQEAARRAPRKVVIEEQPESWFQRFLRSFVAHPAMAAATMLVLVLGVAGTLYLRGDHQYVEKMAPKSDPAPALAPATPSASAPSAPSGVSAGEKGGFEQGYRVDLAESAAPGDAHAALAAADQPVEEGKLAKADPKAAPQNEPQFGSGYATATTKLDASKAEAKKRPYLEVQTEQHAPKDLEDSRQNADKLSDKDGKDTNVLRQRQLDRGGQDLQEAENRRDGTVARGGAGGPANAAPGIVTGGSTAGKPDAAADPTRPEAPRVTAAKPPTTTTRTFDTTVGAVAKETRPTTPAPPATGSGTGAGSAGIARDVREKSAEERAQDESLLAWAKTRHGELQAAVKNNQCQTAANVALDLANRAPSYYAQNVEGDRVIKQCAPYIARVREADAEKRARVRRDEQQRAPSRPADSKAPAPSTNR